MRSITIAVFGVSWLGFTTAPLQAPMELIGGPEAVLEVAASALPLNIVVKLSAVAPNGRSVLITSGWADLSAHGKAGERMRVAVPLRAAAYRLLPGERLRVAERHPDLLRALILAEPGGELDESLGGKPAAAGNANAFTKAADLIAAGDEEGGLRVVAEHTGGPGAWERRPEDRKAISRGNARTMLGQRNEQRRPYSRANAAAIRTPTLFLYGANTRPNFVANVEALSGAISGSKVVVIPNATHGLPYENPVDFNAAIVGFLKAL